MAKTDTKTRILDTAERLFAQKGFDAVSLRNIIASAKVNLAAVHYHFGSKQALVHAVIGRRLRPINGERLAKLAEAPGQGRTATGETGARARVPVPAAVPRPGRPQSWSGVFAVDRPCVVRPKREPSKIHDERVG